jgi:hypothetical protein
MEAYVTSQVYIIDFILYFFQSSYVGLQSS